MKLPSGADAVVDLEKLTGYCLNPNHPRGKHKARVFAAVLGFTVEHASQLRSALLAAAATAETEVAHSDRFGDRYVIEFEITGPKGSGRLRSAWIIRRGERVPRLTSLLPEIEALTMPKTPHLLDVVALLSDQPAHGLLRGQVGTVVEILDGAFEVEFSDDDGKTYAEIALEPDQLLVLHHRPQRAA